VTNRPGPRRLAHWLFPSVVGFVLLLALPEPWWPVAILPAFFGHYRLTRQADLKRPLPPGEVLLAISPLLAVGAGVIVVLLVDSLREQVRPGWFPRSVVFLAWAASTYAVWRVGIKPRPGDEPRAPGGSPGA
jgi:hypothetical protein